MDAWVKDIEKLSLSELLEAQKAIEERLARLSLKSISAETLDRIDSGEATRNATSLVARAEAL